MKQEITNKNQLLKHYDGLEGQVSKQRQVQERSLCEAEHERKVLQEKFSNTERELDANIADNLRLKSLNFQHEHRVHTYQFMIEQAQKRMKLLTERTSKVLHSLEQTLSHQETELKQHTGELDVSKRDLERLRREREHRLEDLRRLEAENAGTKKEQPDAKIEELERQLRAAEAARKDAQTRIEHAHTQWRDSLLLL